ncbi:nucleic acid dioxygenase ALKBH1-like [Scylla paramamosain]|uniref:nucleic acid dioxygenase ALKBH1-like n=1 Tax=Scylla paramamosain TaxID=85552 RepID=UPI003083C487
MNKEKRERKGRETDEQNRERRRGGKRRKERQADREDRETRQKKTKEEEKEEKKDRQTEKTGTQDKEEDKFKDIFKYYKRRKPPPDLTQAIDVDSCCVEVQFLPAASEEDKAVAQEAGLTPPHTWTVHRLVNHPGLVIVRNPFTRAGQLAWACRCLRDMARLPHKTNLASHGVHLEGSTWWQLCRTEEGRRTGLREKLRWVTLGYHHDWDTKEYSEDNRSEMPDSVVRLCGVVARVLGLCGGGGGGGGGEFKAQAGIINYYHHHSTLSPHTDHSEPYMEAPLLSFSFGQSAVFLMGGCTKATAPSAILLHSGDIVVMAGTARLCYHAVPRILMQCERRRRKEEEEEGEEPWAVEFSKVKKQRKKRKVEEKEDEEEEEWEVKTPEMMQKRKEKGEQHKINEDNDSDGDSGDGSDLPDILHYLRTCRINMNIRQVLPPSMDALPS